MFFFMLKMESTLNSYWKVNKSNYLFNKNMKDNNSNVTMFRSLNGYTNLLYVYRNIWGVVYQLNEYGKTARIFT